MAKRSRCKESTSLWQNPEEGGTARRRPERAEGTPGSCAENQRARPGVRELLKDWDNQSRRRWAPQADHTQRQNCWEWPACLAQQEGTENQQAPQLPGSSLWFSTKGPGDTGYDSWGVLPLATALALPKVCRSQVLPPLGQLALGLRAFRKQQVYKWSLIWVSFLTHAF